MLLPRSHAEGVAYSQEHVRGDRPWRPAGPRDPARRLVISAHQRARVLGYIQKGNPTQRAKLLVGGTGAPAGRDKGFWVRPTLFVDVDNAMTIAQEEIFGPVLVVIPFEDEEDAIRIANDSVYGLAGNVMSGSLEHSLAVARRLRAGFVGINGGAPYGADVPFGGYKASGIGRQTGRRVRPVHGNQVDRLPRGVRETEIAAIRRPRGLRKLRRRRRG